MRYLITVLVMSAGAILGACTALLQWPVWGYLAAAVVFAAGLATWPRRGGDDREAPPP